jgi:hypothetical protein
MVRKVGPDPRLQMSVGYLRAVTYAVLKGGKKVSSHFRLMLDSFIGRFTEKQHIIYPDIMFEDNKVFVMKVDDVTGPKIRTFVMVSVENVNIDDNMRKTGDSQLGDIRRIVYEKGGVDDLEEVILHKDGLQAYLKYLGDQTRSVSRLRFAENGLFEWVGE